MVISRSASTTARPVSVPTATVVFSKAGMYLPTSSSRESFFSSTSIMIATLVTALVWDAILKMASAPILLALSVSAHPTDRWNASFPSLSARTTAPAIFPSST